MNSLAICNFNFQGVALRPVERDGDLWFSSSDLAKALGYKKTDAVTQIYSRYSDEFGSNMSTTLRERVVRKTGSVEMLLRFFSLRGAHLVAMFASTTKAKEFRRWVLDILDREVAHSPIAKQFTDEELINLSYMWVWMDKGRRVAKQIYPALNQLGSPHHGFFYDMANESHYMIDKARESLVRETENIDMNGFHARNVQGMLDRLNGKEGIH